MIKFNYNKINSKIPDNVKVDFKLIGRDDNVKYGKYILEHMKSGILFSAYLSSLMEGSCPNIISCFDKTAYFKYLLNNVNTQFILKSSYVDEYTDLLVVDERGILFKCKPSSLLRGFKPTFKSCVDGGTSLFIHQAKKVHGELYDYSNTVFNGKNKHVDILCKKHGTFSQQANSHISGAGCPICANHNNPTFSRSRRVNCGLNSKNLDSFKLYILKCWNASEEFIKVGITYTTIYNRYKCGLNVSMPYHYKVINIIEGDGYYIYDLERYIFSQMHKYSYMPLIPFAGHSECLTSESIGDCLICIENYNHD